MNPHIKHYGQSLAAALTLLAASCLQTHAESFGINYLGNDPNSAVTNTAGQPAMDNWNNIANQTYTSGTIHSSDGALSATLTLSGRGAVRGWNTGVTADGGNWSLLRGYMDNGNDIGSSTNTISGLTGTNYSVILYACGDNARPSNGGDWLPNYSVNGVFFYTATLGGSVGAQWFAQGGITMINDKTYPPTVVQGNFIEVDNVTPVNGTIQVIANADSRTFRSPLNAIQIVASSEMPPNPPQWLAQTPSFTNYAGSTVQVTAFANGTPLNYQWKAGAPGSYTYTNLTDNGHFSGVHTAVLTISNLTSADVADYAVVISNDQGTSDSLYQPTTVSVETMFIDGAIPSQATLYPGGQGRFVSTVTGAEPLTYQWRKNGVPLANGGNISGANTNVLIINNVSSSDAATYDLVVTNIYGAVTNSPATLSLVPAPAAGSYAQALMSLSPMAYWRLGETSGTNAFDYAGSYNAVYQDQAQLGVSGPTQSGWPGFEAGNLAVQISTNTPNSWVELPANNGLDLNTNTLTLTAWIYPLSDPGNWTGIVFHRTTPGGDPGGTGIGFNGNRHLGYNWNNEGAVWNWDSGLTVPLNQWSFVTLVVTPTNATISLANQNGFSSATFIHAHTNASWAGTTAIGHDPIGTDGSRVFDGYIDEVGIFSHALSNSDIVQLYHTASGNWVAPSVSLQPRTQVVTTGTNVQFTTLATGTEPLAYQWQKDGVNLADGNGLSGCTTPTLNLTSVTAANNGNYTLVVTNVSGLATSSPAVLTVITPTNFNAGVLAFGPVGYWRLNETGGTTAADSSGNHLDGTYQSAVTLGAPGIPNPPYLGLDSPGYAAALNGQSGSWVTLPGLNLNSANVTFTAWIKPTTTAQPNATGLIFCRDGQGTTSGFGYGGSQQLGYTWNDNNWGWNSGLTPPTNQWSFVALVITPTVATVYMFNTNGWTSASDVTGHSSSVFAGETRIGNDSLGANRAFLGSMAEVAVYNSSLTAAQITQLYLNGSYGPQSVTPPQGGLEISHSGSNLTLTWSSGVLLEATNLVGPWTTNSAATSPFNLTPSEPQKFYRIQAP